MLTDFQREYLLRLPLPLAQLYSRAHNAKDARGRHDNAFYLCEALVKLAAAPAVACYLHETQHGLPRVEALDRLLVQLALPSLGQWVALLRELSRAFDSRVDADRHPLGRLHEQLNRPRKDLPGLLALYRRIKNGPDGAPAGDQSCSVMQVLDALVQYRNQVFGHGGPRFDSFFEKEMGPLLFPAVNDLFAENVVDWLGPPSARLAYLTEIRTLDDAQVEVGLRELVGRDSERAAPLRLSAEQSRSLLPNRVVVLWPGRPVPLRLDPLLVYRETDQGEDVLFLNRDRNSRQVEYLSYFSGKTEREASMAPVLTALLSLATGQPVSEERLAAFQAQSLAETPSVEALTGEQPLAGQVLGDYALLGVLGRGGMGVVYLARQLSLGRLVALKTLPADLAGDEVALGRLRREIRALGRCEHPHIVKVLTSGVLPDGQPYYTMEYVPGCDLERVWQEVSGAAGRAADLSGSSWRRAVLTASKKQRAQILKASVEAPSTAALPLPPFPDLPPPDDDPGGYVRRVVTLMRDAARAVQGVHEQNLIHRDVKPANLMLTPDGGRVVLMDFGLAKSHTVSRALSTGGGLLGTLRYAAPEQLAAANLKVGPEADVRGLGVTLWELLTRRRLFADAADETQLAQMVHDRDVPRLRKVEPSFDRDLEAIVARATERRVADRIASAWQMADYLQLWLNGRPIPIRTPGVGELLKRWVRAHKPLVNSMAAALLTVLAVVVIAFLRINAALEEKKGALEKEQGANTLAQQRLSDKEKAYGELKAAQDELEGETARSWLLPLAIQRGPLSAQEIEVLSAVAAKRYEPLAYRFLKEGVEEPRFIRRLGTRSEYALHAAVGLDTKKRDQVEALLVARLHAPGMAEASRRDLALALADLGDLSPSTATVVAPILTEAIKLTRATKGRGERYTLFVLAKRLSAVAARMEPKEGAATLAQAIAQTRNADARMALARGLSVVAARMEPRETARVLAAAAAEFIEAMTKTTDLYDLDRLAEGLSAVAARMEPKEAQEAAATLIQAITKTTNFGTLSTLAESLAAMAAKMEAKEAKETAALVIQAMTKTTDFNALSMLTRGLSAVAARMGPKEAAATLNQVMTKTYSDENLLALAKDLSAVAARMEPTEAARVSAEAAATITQAMTKRNFVIKAQLAVGLAAVVARMEPTEAARVSGEVAAKFTEAMTKTTDLNELTALAWGLSAVSACLDAKEAGEAAATLNQVMTKTTDEETLQALAESLSAVAARLKPTDATRVLAAAAAKLGQAMTKMTNGYKIEYASHYAYSLRALARGLSAVAARLEPKDAARVAAEVAAKFPKIMNDTAKAYTDHPRLLIDLGILSMLAEGLSALAVHMEPKDAARVSAEAAATLTHMMTETGDTFKVLALAKGLSVVAAQMEPKAAARVLGEAASTLTQALSRAGDETDQRKLAESLVVVAVRMEPQEATATLTHAMTRTTFGFTFQPLPEGLSVVAVRMGPKEAKEAATTLIQAAATAKTDYESDLRPLTKSLSAVLGDGGRNKRAITVSAVVASLDNSNSLASTLLLLKLNEVSLPSRLTDQDLVEILKDPLCVDLARRAVLDELGERHQRRCTDQWEFVRFAQDNHLGFDFTTPPKRP